MKIGQELRKFWHLTFNFLWIKQTMQTLAGKMVLNGDLKLFRLTFRLTFNFL